VLVELNQQIADLLRNGTIKRRLLNKTCKRDKQLIRNAMFQAGSLQTYAIISIMLLPVLQY
jgi:hypothetical protein